MPEKPRLEAPDTISVALETNWRGYLGHIVELPGAYVRGPGEEEALAKVRREVDSYLAWLNVAPLEDYRVRTVQKHRGIRMVEDAETEILLDADKLEMTDEEFNQLSSLAHFSSETFSSLFADSTHRDWVDKSAIRETFYGSRPASIDAISEHVMVRQFFLLSRMKITDQTEGDLTTIREFCLSRLSRLYRKSNNTLTYEKEGESWTLKKVLRRLIWHDRIHGKAVTRILDKQKASGMIDNYEDFFQFGKDSP